MKTELIRFLTGDKLRLEGLLFEPDTKVNRVVIQVHGAESYFYRNKFLDEFSVKFTKTGWALLTFNNRGCGMEYKHYRQVGDKLERVLIGQHNEIFEESEIDIQAAIDFAKSRGYDEVVLSGHSFGCNKVTWYAIDKGFKGKMILLAPCDLARASGDPKYAERFEMAKELVAQGRGHEKILAHGGRYIAAVTVLHTYGADMNVDMFRYRDAKVVPAVAALHNDVLVQIGTQDEHILQPNKQDCLDYLKRDFADARVTMHLINGAFHNFEGYESEVVKNILTWLR